MIRTLSIRGAAALVFMLGLFATALICQQAWLGRREAQKAKFDSDAAILKNALLERLHRHAQVLQGMRGLFAASREVEEPEFKAYISSLRAEPGFPGILALGFIEMVAHGQREEFLRKAVRTDGKSLQIRPGGARADYLVVRFVEPMESNHEALGFDIGSESARRNAAMDACDSSEARLTARIELVQAPGKPGAILLEPVYRGGTVPNSIDERRMRLQGWVYAAFVMEDMMDGVRQLTNSHLEYEIHDGSTPSAENLLCRGGLGLPPALDGGLEQNSDLVVFGRPWNVRIRSPGGSSGDQGILPVGILAGGGICMSLLIFGVVHSMATTSKRACSLAEVMTEELRQQKESLLASEERLAMVIKGSNDGIWDWDVITNEVYFSPRWKSMLGYEDDEIENNFNAWESLLHPDDRDRARLMVSGYFEGKIPSYQLEHRLRHKDGSYRCILARGVALRDASGRPLRMAGSHMDLTGLKQAEQELRRANLELQESQSHLQSALADLNRSHKKLEQTQIELIQAAKLESVGTLAAGVAHEVKNPLQIIIMGLDFLDWRLHDGEETIRTTLSDMRDAAMRADSISRELLHFSSSTRFMPGPADLDSVIERSLLLLRTDINHAGVTVIKQLSGKLPPVSIDAQKVQQVLINLIVNALQAMNHRGTLTISSASGRLGRLLPPRLQATCPIPPDDPCVILRLHDTGPGIPEDQLPRIFDPFFTTKPVGSGTGLGLSVVKRIIDLHHGFIHFRNSPHGGMEVILAFAATNQTAACTVPPDAAAVTTPIPTPDPHHATHALETT